MSWFGDNLTGGLSSISNLTGQISSFTREMLTEGTDEVSDPLAELKLATDRIRELEAGLVSQKLESERLQLISDELHEKVESAELQNRHMRADYRAQIQEKEQEVTKLKEMLGSDHDKVIHSEGLGKRQRHDSLEGINDSFEVRNLRSEVSKLQAECEHWKALANGSESKDKLHKEIDQYQHELAALQSSYAQKIANLNKKHKLAVQEWEDDRQEFHDRIDELEKKLKNHSNADSESSSAAHAEDTAHKDVTAMEAQLDSAQSTITSLKVQLQGAENKNTEIMAELSEIKESLKTAQASLKEQNQGQATTEVDGLTESRSDLENQVRELQSQLLSRENAMSDVETREVEIVQTLKDELSHVKKENIFLQETCDKSLYQERRMCRSLEEVKGEMESLSSATMELMEQLESSRDVQQEQSIELEVLRNAGSKMEGDGKDELIKLRNALAALWEQYATVTNHYQQVRHELNDSNHRLLMQLQTRHLNTQAMRQELANVQDGLDERSFRRLDKVTEEREVLMTRSAELSGQVEEQQNVVNDLQLDSDHIGQLAKDWVGELGYKATVGGDDGGDIVSSLEAEKALLETTVVGLEKKVLDLEEQLRSMKSEDYVAQETQDEQSLNDSFSKFSRYDDSVYLELQDQLEEYRGNLEEMDLVRSDLEGEKEALENLVVDLRRQLKDLQRREVDLTANQVVSEPQRVEEQDCESFVEVPLEVSTPGTEQSVNYVKRIREEFVSLGVMRPDQASVSGNDSDQVEALLLCLKDWTEQKELELRENQDLNAWTSISTSEETQTEEDLSLVRREVEKFEKDNSILREETEKLIHELEAKTVEISLLQNQMDDSRFALAQISNEKRDLVGMINERDEKIGELEDSFESQIMQLTTAKDSDLSLLQTKHEDVLTLLDESRSEFLEVKKKNEDLLNMIEERQLSNDELLSKNREMQSSISALESQLESVSTEKDNLISQNLALSEENDRLQTENATLGELMKESEEKIRVNEEKNAEFLNLNVELERLNKRAERDQGNFEHVQEELTSCRKENKELASKVNETESQLVKLGSSLSEKITELDLLNKEMDKVNEYAATRDALCKEQEHKILIGLQEKEELLQSLGERERQTDKVQLDLREKGAENDLLRLDIAKLNRGLKEKEELLQRQFSGSTGVVSESLSREQTKLTQMFHMLEGKDQEIDALRLKNTSLVEVVTETERNQLQTQGEYELRIRTLMEERESLLIEVAEKDDELITQRDRLDAMKEKMFSKDQASTMLHGEHSKLLALNESQGNEIAKLRERMSSLQKMLEDKETRIYDLQREHQGNAQMTQQMNSWRVEHERLSTLIHEKDQQISFLVGMGSQSETPVVPTLQSNVQQSAPSQEQDLLTRERDSLKREVDEYKASFSNLQVKFDALTRDLGEEKSTASKLKQENEVMKKELAEVKSRVSKAEVLKSTWLDPTEANRMEREIKELKRDVEDKSLKLNSIKKTLESEKNSVLVDLENVRSERDFVSQQKDKETTELKNKMLQLLRSVTNGETNDVSLHHGLEDIDNNFQALLQFAKTTRDTAIRERENEIKSLREQISNLNVLNRTSSQSRDTDLMEALREKEELHQLLVRTENEKEDSLKEKEALVADLQDQVISLTEIVSEKSRTSSRELEVALKRKDGLERDLQRALTEKEHVVSANEQKEKELSKLQSDVQRLVEAAAEERGKVAELERALEEKTAVHQGKDTAITSLMTEREQLAKDSELMEQKVSQLQNSLIESNNEKKEIQEKAKRELDRLRDHLIQVEESYTREALTAEERERDLRLNLSRAEEQVASSSHSLLDRDRQASHQLESVQEQLLNMASQRDNAVLQLANAQEQAQQYSMALNNLQMVLEQFQRDKTADIQSVHERAQQEVNKAWDEMRQLQQKENEYKAQLQSAARVLQEVQNLQQELGKKEEEVHTYKLEVDKLEVELKSSQDKIKELNNNSDNKIDKTLLKNLLMSYFNAPEARRPDAVHVIGSLLGFSADEMTRVGSGSTAPSRGSGWISSFMPFGGTPKTPTKTAANDKSFTELFVSFLEHESETTQGVLAPGANGTSATNPLLTGLTPRTSTAVQSDRRPPLATSTPVKPPVSVNLTPSNVGTPVGSSVSSVPLPAVSSSQAHTGTTDAVNASPIRPSGSNPLLIGSLGQMQELPSLSTKPSSTLRTVLGSQT